MTETDEKNADEGRLNRPRRLELKKTVETGQVRQSFAHGRSKMVTVEVRKKRTFAADGRGGRAGDQRGEGGRGRGDAHGRDAASTGLTTQEKAARARALEGARRAEEDRVAMPAAELEPVAAEIPAAEVTQPETEAAAPELASAAEQVAAQEAAPVATAETAIEAAESQVVEPAAETELPVQPSDGEGAGSIEEASAAATEAVEPGQAGAELSTPLAAAGETAAEPAAEAPAPRAQAEAVAPSEAITPRGPGGAESRVPAGRPAAPVGRSGGAPAARPPRTDERQGRPAGERGPSRADAGRKPEAPAGVGRGVAKPRSPAAQEDTAARAGRTKRVVRTEVRRTEEAGLRADEGRRGGKISVTHALDEAERVRSLASVRRARQKERLKQIQALGADSQKIIRDIIIPESITVQELANRMAARSTDVIKVLMRMGMMVTINHSIDGDTAELVATEFGHNIKRVSDADVELGLRGEPDAADHLQPRPPVVTVMGHVDHGKTSLLDALRKSDVAAHEAGGITQHIGAYQVTLAGGQKITFIDTPGHEAFTQMRARGARVTDIVVLVVAADDGVMPQTVEAIAHAKAAGVPLIVAVNKCDRPDADPRRVRTELMQHSVFVEDMGGDTLSVDVSAKTGSNLDKLAEAILLQAEVLDLHANPDRSAEGVVIEARMERGRGTVATVLVQRGTLRPGDVFVAGSEWGRVRTLADANGATVERAGPGMPVEILGLNSTPAAGDDVIVVDSEARAREVSEFRQRRSRDARTTTTRGTLEQMLNRIQEGEARELAVVVKADVHGSVEAIAGALQKIGGEHIKVNVLHSGVGGINETDIGLARASGALVIGFNVRANPQAREMAKRDGVEIRYYSIIYDLTDDIRTVLTGMLKPTVKENILGYAQIRQVFNISKVGKVAGCMITEGVVRRGAKVRLLRDDVVIHTGDLGQLKRFKEDVREVKDGYDCGISLLNYHDIQVGDTIECYELEEVAREL
ncbi:MAG: translation initiation factor IF-2 [Defluviicoccus sp.]|nr:translation initiation factor IF-2 [Defluviicoccus sp.]MDG4609405.1 translation initiation factor IF-2 [Defluviicoccus sp.]